VTGGANWIVEAGVHDLVARGASVTIVDETATTRLAAEVDGTP